VYKDGGQEQRERLNVDANRRGLCVVLDCGTSTLSVMIVAGSFWTVSVPFAVRHRRAATV